MNGGDILKNLKELRTKKGLTQRDMAEKLRVAVSSYNMYENGQRKIPSEIAYEIANILKVDIRDIFLPMTFTTSKTETA